MENEIGEGVIFHGSGNVFDDLGFPDPKEMLAKAGLAVAIKDAIKARKLTQVDAAKILGIDQPKVSKIMRGHLSEFSIERLLNYLVHLGLDIDIIIHQQAPQTMREGTISIAYV